jgi:hypothetical protein
MDSSVPSRQLGLSSLDVCSMVCAEHCIRDGCFMMTTTRRGEDCLVTTIRGSWITSCGVKRLAELWVSDLGLSARLTRRTKATDVRRTVMRGGRRYNMDTARIGRDRSTPSRGEARPQTEVARLKRAFYRFQRAHFAAVAVHSFAHTPIGEGIGIDIDALGVVPLGLCPLLHLLSPCEPFFPSAGHLVGIVEEFQEDRIVLLPKPSNTDFSRQTEGAHFADSVAAVCESPTTPRAAVRGYASVRCAEWFQAFMLAQ